VVCASRPNREQVHGIVRPALCIVAQGAKTVLLGKAPGPDRKPAKRPSTILIFPA